MTHGSGPQPLPTDPFPTIPWTPTWPVSGRSAGSRIITLVIVALFCIGAVAAVVSGINSWRDDPHLLTTVIGWLGLAVALFSIGVAALGGTGLPALLKRPTIFRHTDQTHGTGLRLRPRGNNPVLFTALLGFAVYGIMAWAGWQEGIYQDGLLSLSKNNGSGAVLALIFGIIMLVSVIVLPILMH